MNPTKSYPITVLRVVCVIQVFFIHYFTGHGLKEYDWIWGIAVPSFLLVSAYLYGLRRKNGTSFHFDFLKKRYISLSCVLYPFLLVTYFYFVITDSNNIIQYTRSFFAECCYFVDFITPLPTTGHIWFMQTLAMCYIAMFVASHVKIVEKWFTSPIKILLMLFIVILCGYIYRGSYLVHIFFYLLVYYNANRIKNMKEKINIFCLMLLLMVGYLLLSTKYLELFHYGIYLQYIQLCIMAIMNILFFNILCENWRESKFVNFIGSISMEIYLVHHFIVYDYPLSISIPVTLILSVLLYQVSIYTKKMMNKLLF